jgi:hypothetical protein
MDNARGLPTLSFLYSSDAVCKLFVCNLSHISYTRGSLYSRVCLYTYILAYVLMTYQQMAENC